MHKKEINLQNWNRTMIQATRLFFLLCWIEFFLYPQKSFSCPWHMSCLIFKTAEDHNPTRSALLPPQQRPSPLCPSSPTTPRPVLFFNYFYFIIPLKRQNPKCNLLEEENRTAVQGGAATPPMVSGWRLSVNASLIWDAKESAAVTGEMGGVEKVGVSLWRMI